MARHAVQRSFIALLAGVDVPVAAVGHELALRIAATEDGRLALLAARFVQDPVTAEEADLHLARR